MTDRWVLCPKCQSKTRLKIQDNTELKNFPLFCPKCRAETLIDVKHFQVKIIEQPDAKTQS
jgi:Zn finger protein HypA/HybF involved in hydrogenase expression